MDHGTSGPTHAFPSTGRQALVFEGASIGPYRLVRKLGEGGMGIVFEAQQLEPIRRTVALKVIKPGMDSEQVITRFEGERQALALMDHANIARVFDAGTTETGLPFFVMELVDGVPITRYCDDRRLSIRSRIELVILACHAIQHAHQKGIIHRDIKPSNVLVKEQDGAPVLKVIDFGLAKALSTPLTDATVMTHHGLLLGTVRYMSPEQAAMTGRDADTRSDVYSLGVLLYELLTGTTPLDRESIEQASLLDALRRIGEEDVRPPSECLRESGDRGTVALLRQSDPLRLPGQVNGELDWITLKALEKDRAARYETVSGLERDLRRYLEGEPVDAAPPSAAYRVRKLVRRHRWALATAAGFVILVVAAAIGGVWLAIRASRAEQEARAVNDFLRNDVLAQASAGNQANPSTSPDQNLTVRMALDRAAARIGERFAGEPLVEASIRQTMGDTYFDLGLYEQAQEQLERAITLRRRLLGDVDGDTQASVLSLAQVVEQRGRYDEAEKILAPLVDALRRSRGADHIDTLNAVGNLGRLFSQQGKYAEAEAMLQAALAGQRRTLGDDNVATLTTMNSLALVYFSQSKYAQAEPLYRTLVDIRTRVLGPEHPSTLISKNNMAGLHRVRGQYEEAERLYLEVRDVRTRVLGATHPDTLASMYNLAALYQSRGRAGEAEPLYREVLAARQQLLGADHPRTLATQYAVAVLMRSLREYGEAERLLEEVLLARRRTLGDTHLDTLDTQLVLARVQLDAQHYAAAERLVRPVLSHYEQTGAAGWSRGAAETLLGESLAGQRQFAAAEPLLLRGYSRLTAVSDEIPADEQQVFARAREALRTMYENWGRPDKAAEWATAQ